MSKVFTRKCLFQRGTDTTYGLPTCTIFDAGDDDRGSLIVSDIEEILGSDVGEALRAMRNREAVKVIITTELIS